MHLVKMHLIIKKMEEREYLLPWEQIFYLMNGIDINGFPLSASMITVHEVFEENKLKVVQEYEMFETPVTVSMSGGCVVAAFNFPQKEKANFEKVNHLCQDWLRNLNDTVDDNKILSLIITPVLMEGTFSLLLRNLVFAEGYMLENEYRLILCFDNEQTQPYILEGVDMNKMLYDIDSQLNRELDEIRDSIEEAEGIIQQSKDENPYEKRIKDKMLNIKFNQESEDDSTQFNSGIRVAKEEDKK